MTRKRNDKVDNPPGHIICNRFKIEEKIGSGSFGEVFSAVDLKRGKKVAIKAERSNSENPQLEYESKVYKKLKGGVGIPDYKDFKEENGYNYLVINLLGPSLEDLLNLCNKNFGAKKFSMKTTLMLSEQLISRLEYVHSKGFIYRDVKPDNFLVNKTKNNAILVYLIDFGLSKSYRDKDNVHIPDRNDKKLIGTTRYVSVNTHIGREQSRRDDLESLGYLLVYLSTGNLPWQNMQAKTGEQKLEKVKEMKMSTTAESLCEYLPPEFAVYLNYCKGLGFQQTPDYAYLRQLFLILFRTLGYYHNNKYDWSLLQ